MILVLYVLADLCNRITFGEAPESQEKPPLSTGRLRFWRTRRRIQTQGTISFPKIGTDSKHAGVAATRKSHLLSLSLQANDSNLKSLLALVPERDPAQDSTPSPTGKIASYFLASPMSPISVTGGAVHSKMVVVQLVNSPQRGCWSCGYGKQWPWGCQG